MTGFAVAADVAIYSKLIGSTALTALTAGGTASPSVYPAPAPADAETPYVVYQTGSGSTPVRTLGGVAYENAVYIVKAVDVYGDPLRAGTIAMRIEEALRQPLTVAGHNHMQCSREQDISYPETLPGGEVAHHRGALYRLQASPT